MSSNEERQKRKEARKRKKEQRAILGLCIKCDNPKQENCQMCVDCSEVRKKSSKEQYDRYYKDDPEQKAKRKEYRESNKEEIRLKNKEKGAENLVIAAKRRDRLRKDGFCTNCGKNKVCGNTDDCETCFYKHLAQTYLRASNRWEEIKSIFNSQKGLCGKTKHPIQLGINASIDHVKPVSIYPELKYDIANIRFVHFNINMMKRHINENSFGIILNNIIMMYNSKEKE